MDTNTYALTLVYPVDETRERLEKLVSEMLTKQKVKVVATEDWGQKTLAYPVKKHEEGVYQHLKVEATGANILKLKDRLRLERGVLRWLLVSDGDAYVGTVAE